MIFSQKEAMASFKKDYNKYNMNHTIKAKDKKTGEVIDISLRKDSRGYLFIDCGNGEWQVTQQQLNDIFIYYYEYLTQQEFNDLFEVVEDKPFKHHTPKKYKVKIRRGDNWKVKPEAEELDGKVFEFKYGWTFDEDEMYAGEYAMQFVDETSPLSWMASGDLVEVVEDSPYNGIFAQQAIDRELKKIPKFKIGDSVTTTWKEHYQYGLKGVITKRSIEKDAVKWWLNMEDGTLGNFYEAHLELIPQTDTLKKEDWEVEFNLKYYDDLPINLFNELKNFITQEIAKAKEEVYGEVNEKMKQLKDLGIL